jgi:CHAT domain-containing protein
LWAVDDRSTMRLMQRFYRLRTDKPAQSKADDLREAQLSLLYGSVAEPAAVLAKRSLGSNDESMRREVHASPFVTNPRAPYAHPFYWAPFILIGNWR